MAFRSGRALMLAATMSLAVVLGAILLRPGQAACAILPALPLERLADGSLADVALSPTDRRAAINDRRAAVGRIATTFGAPRATPLVIYLSAPDALWPIAYGSFGSTDFLPGRTCVVIGPDGRNVDVVAHELMHAEIADRAGFWRRWRQIPVWFDEGVAMQVDARAAFARPRKAGGSIRSKDTAARFFVDSPDDLTEHYAQARHEAAAWLDRIGHRRLYDRLSAIARGEDFADVWAR